MSKKEEKYFYVYYSYEPWGRGYIGKRECCCLPEEDIKYLGSFKDKTFKPTEKIILEIFETREDAYNAEARLHEFYDVKNNPHFANQVHQTIIKEKMFRYFKRFKNKIKRTDNKEYREKLIMLVKESTSVRQIAIKLGFKSGGRSNANIKNDIEYLNLDTLHFTGQGWKKDKKSIYKMSEKQKEKYHYKFIYTITTPEGKTIITKNFKKYCTDNKLNHRNMWMVSIGKTKSCKGYKVHREPIQCARS